MKQKSINLRRISAAIFIGLGLLSIVVLGALIGLVVAVNYNTMKQGTVGDITLALPTKIYDLEGNMVTEFFGVERREIIDYNDIPRPVVQALISREDRHFFEHSGFSVLGTTRAMFKIIQLKVFGSGFVSGGSTLSQQVAGHLYADRTVQTSSRKLRELWWAWQIEKHRSKQEILEIYLNKMPFGHNTYGIQAASRFFFGEGVEKINSAQSVMLVIQLANPSGRYSPIRAPRRSKIIQETILNQMVDNNFISRDDAVSQLAMYWDDFDWSRDAAGTAFLNREDLAPYFSEYIRNELNKVLSGRRNIYTDGYQVYTTLNVAFQTAADEEINRGLQIASERLRQNNDTRYDFVNESYLPMVDMLALNFGMDKLRIEGGQLRRFAMDYYNSDLNSLVDLTTAMFGFTRANTLTGNSYRKLIKNDASGRIQSALITIEQSSGYILSLIGGRRFDRLDQLNRAVTARIMPGSSFKPLYFAEAIASGRLTAASNLDNYAKGWINEDESIYSPTNYDGQYSNQGVRLRRALALSLNIPAVSVLDTIGFDAAIARSSRLLGITDPQEISRTFPRTLALALGTIGVTPLQMARAFASFANGGRDVEPIAIRYIKDRNGRIVVDVENDAKRLGRMASSDNQIISPQAATIMLDILEDAVRYGTLYWAATNTRNELPLMDQPIAGKTGTSQNWADAWAIASSPYYTTAVWLGFDKGGQTLGVGNEASSSSAYILMRYMKKIHQGLERGTFTRAPGIVSVAIDADTGLLPSIDSTNVIYEMFMAGTAPTEVSDRYGSYMGNFSKPDEISNILRGNSSSSPWGVDPLGGIDITLERLNFSTPATPYLIDEEIEESFSSEEGAESGSEPLE